MLDSAALLMPSTMVGLPIRSRCRCSAVPCMVVQKVCALIRLTSSRTPLHSIQSLSLILDIFDLAFDLDLDRTLDQKQVS